MDTVPELHHTFSRAGRLLLCGGGSFRLASIMVYLPFSSPFCGIIQHNPSKGRRKRHASLLQAIRHLLDHHIYPVFLYFGAEFLHTNCVRCNGVRPSIPHPSANTSDAKTARRRMLCAVRFYVIYREAAQLIQPFSTSRTRWQRPCRRRCTAWPGRAWHRGASASRAAA